MFLNREETSDGLDVFDSTYFRRWNWLSLMIMVVVTKDIGKSSHFFRIGCGITNQLSLKKLRSARETEMKKYTLVHRWYHWRNEEWSDDQNSQPLAQNENDFLNAPAAFRKAPSLASILLDVYRFIDESVCGKRMHVKTR